MQTTSSSSFSFSAIGFDSATHLVLDAAETPSTSSIQPIDNPPPGLLDSAPTLADLGAQTLAIVRQTVPIRPFTQTFQAYFETPPEARYHQAIQNDEKLEQSIQQSIEALIELYDQYHPMISKGLAVEEEIQFIERAMNTEQQKITQTIQKLRCPIKKFKAEYRLAVLTEDEEVYRKLIDSFFKKIFAQQNTDQRLELLTFLAEPSPRPLAIDFELFRLDCFLKILNNPKLPFEYEEKRTLVDAHLDFAASCLAKRSMQPISHLLWNKWVSLSKIYHNLDKDFECRQPRAEGTLYQNLTLAFTTYYTQLSRNSASFLLYSTICAALVDDIDLLREALETLKNNKTPEKHILPPHSLILLAEIYSSPENSRFNIPILSLIAQLYLTIIDRPADYEVRWQKFEQLCLTLLDIAETRKAVSCLTIVQTFLNDHARNSASFLLYSTICAALANDIDLLQEALETLKNSKTPEKHILPPHFLILLVNTYSSSENSQFNIPILSLIAQLYLIIINRPADYEVRWQKFEQLCLTLLGIAKTKQAVSCLKIVHILLNDHAADLNYKKTVYTYLRSLKMNHANRVEEFNAKELCVRDTLKREIKLVARQLKATHSNAQ